MRPPDEIVQEYGDLPDEHSETHEISIDNCLDIRLYSPELLKAALLQTRNIGELERAYEEALPSVDLIASLGGNVTTGNKNAVLTPAVNWNIVKFLARRSVKEAIADARNLNQDELDRVEGGLILSTITNLIIVDRIEKKLEILNRKHKFENTQLEFWNEISPRELAKQDINFEPAKTKKNIIETSRLLEIKRRSLAKQLRSKNFSFSTNINYVFPEQNHSKTTLSTYISQVLDNGISHSRADQQLEAIKAKASLSNLENRFGRLLLNLDVRTLITPSELGLSSPVSWIYNLLNNDARKREEYLSEVEVILGELSVDQAELEYLRLALQAWFDLEESRIDLNIINDTYDAYVTESLHPSHQERYRFEREYADLQKEIVEIDILMLEDQVYLNQLTYNLLKSGDLKEWKAEVRRTL